MLSFSPAELRLKFYNITYIVIKQNTNIHVKKHNIIRITKIIKTILNFAQIKKCACLSCLSMTLREILKFLIHFSLINFLNQKIYD